MGGGPLALPRSPAGAASHAARTGLQGAHRGDAHQRSEPFSVPGPGSPAKLLGCHSRARLSAYLPGPHAAPDGARRTFQPSAQGQAALVTRKPTARTALAPLLARTRRDAGRVLPRPLEQGAADQSRSQRRGRARARAPRQAGIQRVPAGCGTREALSW